SRAVPRRGISPTAASLPARSSPIRVSHWAVSPSRGKPEAAAAASCSTLTLTSSATRCDTLPRRMLFLLPSVARNWMVRRPFGPREMLAIALSLFLRRARAGSDREVQQRRQGVGVRHRQPALPAHEAAHRRFGQAQRLAEAVA